MIKLREYQSAALDKLRASLAGGNRRVMLYSPTGCHAAGEMILMADGTARAAEAIAVGDRLMGMDGYRTVTALHQGRQTMARVIPTKGDPFSVNLGHLLSLVHTSTGEIIDIAVAEWLAWTDSRKRAYKLYRSGVERFDVTPAPLPMNPWLLGVLLGDGSLGGSPLVTNPEPSIQVRVCELAGGVVGQVRQYGGKCPAVHLRNAPGVGNPLADTLKNLGLRGRTARDKFIPRAFMVASLQSRRELLAGLLDTDGHLSKGGYDWITASERLADDLVFVARSVGLAAYKSSSWKRCQTGAGGLYWRVSLSGDFSRIPTVKRQPFARGQVKNVLRTGFTVELLPEADYFGFQVDGDHRYLMADFTVTHNSGKTEIGMAMVHAARAKGRKVAFIANRKELIRQASRRFITAGIHHGIVQAENTVDLLADVLICSIDTVHVRGLPDDIDLFIVDEAHAVAGSKKYRELLFRFNAVPAIGLSATPFTVGLGRHYDELGGPLFQELIEAATIRELIDRDYLVDVDIFAPSTPDLTSVATRKGKDSEVDYVETQLAEAVDKPALVGDIVSHWLRLARGKPTVVFATTIAHSKHIVERFQVAGVAAAHLDYHFDDEARAAVLARFNAGEITVLSNAGLLAEGWDAPHTECMILARPTKSLTRFIQMVGRVLRPFEGKTKALMLDHSGSTERLGYPTDDLPLELDDGRPKAAGTKRTKERLPSACPSCSYMRPPGVHVCPVCGFAPERQSNVETREGELVKVARQRKADKFEKQSAYSQLTHIADERGYSDGWVSHKYRALFGVWPRGLDSRPIEPTPEMRSWVKSQAIRFAKRKEAGHASIGA